MRPVGPATGPRMTNSGALLRPPRGWQMSWSLLLVLAGLLLLYLPSFHDLLTGLWREDRHAHGPIVLAVAAWLFYFHGRQVLHASSLQPSAAAGWLIFLLGLLMYLIGRSQSFHLFEIGSLIPVLLGVVLILQGRHAASRLWFAFFFLLFAVPLPASLVDAMTQPMKLVVSYAAEHLLAQLHYPVARDGVIIDIGPYRLLVADACAGLNSLFTLEALGLLYMNVMRHESVLRNTLLALLIVPISFASNVTRVVLLALITYHWGDGAGQGFLHQFSGILLFVTALMLTIGADAVIRAIARRRGATHAD